MIRGKKRSSYPSVEGKESLKRLNRDFDRQKKVEQLFTLLKGLSNSRLQKGIITIEAPAKSNLTPFSTEHLKPSNINVNKLARSNANLYNRKVSSASVLDEELVQKKNISSQFLSLLVDKGRLIRHVAVSDQLARKAPLKAQDAQRLSQAKKLLLLQALRREPLPFLDLHVLFGVSKETIRRLVKRGFLSEDWGPKAIGLRFKLSEKGRSYLNKLEAVSKYESKTTRKGLIRLKNRAFL